MNRDRTVERIRIVSIVSVCILGLAVVINASAQQQQPTVGGKSKGRAVSREDVASLLNKAASLLQAGKLDEAEKAAMKEDLKKHSKHNAEPKKEEAK